MASSGHAVNQEAHEQCEEVAWNGERGVGAYHEPRHS